MMRTVRLSWVDPMTGQQRREQFVLPLIIGRDSTNDLTLQDPLISRRHALIRQEHDQIVITDLQSGNGTWIDGQRIEQALLRDGTAIRLGTTVIMLAIPSQDSQGATLVLADDIDGYGETGDVGSDTQLDQWGKGLITHIASSPDGNMLAVASTLGVQLHDAHTFDERQFIQIERPVEQMMLTHDGTILATTSTQGVECWRVQQGKTHHTVVEREHITT